MRIPAIAIVIVSCLIAIGVYVYLYRTHAPGATCEAADGTRVAIGSAENGAICTNAVPGGWAVAAPEGEK